MAVDRKRRRFFKAVALLGLSGRLWSVGHEAEARPLFPSPVRTNRLRPPGAVPEELFPLRCVRCGRCVEVCPYGSIRPLDIRNGVFAGTPVIDVTKVPCWLCMKCVEVCPTGSLQKVSQQDVRMGMAIIDKHSCFTWKEEGLLCHTCYNVCPFKETAIKLQAMKPVVVEDKCTGCGLCVHACPVTRDDGEKAINVQPVYSFDAAGSGHEGR